MRKALVTGATGLLGSYIVRRLTADGISVRALVRHPSQSESLAAQGVESSVGALEDVDSLRAAAAGCDLVFNCAARIGASSDWQSFYEDNVRGVENLVTAVGPQGRLVHVSSTSVFGRHRYFERPTDETCPLPELAQGDAYGRSKQQAERVVLRAHQERRIWATVVRPPMMYGVGDRRFIPWLVAALKWRVFPLIDGGKTTMTLVHAGSVADAAVQAAMTDAAAGQVYHLTNDFDVTSAELVRYSAGALGRRIFTPRIPGSLARGGLSTLAAVLTLAGQKELAPHARGLFQTLARNNPFSSSKARRELGWTPRVAHSDGVPEAIHSWLASEQRPTSMLR